jgi:hypothetical protein
MWSDVLNPSGSNIVVLGSEQVKECSSNEEVTTIMYE